MNTKKKVRLFAWHLVAIVFLFAISSFSLMGQEYCRDILQQAQVAFDKGDLNAAQDHLRNLEKCGDQNAF
jgi:hypothetical protein